MPPQNQNPFAPFGGVFGAGLTGMNNAFQALHAAQPWWQQQPTQQQLATPPQQQNPWTPAAVQALMHGMSQDKATRAISPADQYKAGMWASVPGSVGGAPAAPFSWNMPGGTNDPVGRIQHYLGMMGALPTRVQSPGMPSINMWDPNAQVQNRVLPNPTTMQLAQMNQRQDTGWQYGTPPPVAAVSSPWAGFNTTANPRPGFSF